MNLPSPVKGFNVDFRNDFVRRIQVRLCTKLFKQVRLCTKLYKQVRLCTKLYKQVRLCTKLYKQSSNNVKTFGDYIRQNKTREI